MMFRLDDWCALPFSIACFCSRQLNAYSLCQHRTDLNLHAHQLCRSHLNYVCRELGIVLVAAPHNSQPSSEVTQWPRGMMLKAYLTRLFSGWPQFTSRRGTSPSIQVVMSFDRIENPQGVETMGCDYLLIGTELEPEASKNRYPASSIRMCRGDYQSNYRDPDS
ncbi:hypothetical protein F5B21DRAFT_20633 [Xylaria acuta]|nr:hypothetical protein F5B21DRAFT_20633 [Xylaria acuta]